MATHTRRRSKLKWFLGLLLLTSLGGGGAAAWHYQLVPREPVERILTRFGLLKPAEPKIAQSDTGQEAPSSPAIDPAFAASAADAANQANAGTLQPPPSSADDWYNEATPTLAAAPPEQAPAAPAQPASTPADAAAQSTPPAAGMPPENNPFAAPPTETAATPATNAPPDPALQTAPAADGVHPAEFEPETGAVATATEGAGLPAAEAPDPRLEIIDQLIESGEILQAHRELSTLYWNDESIREAIRDRIETTARSIYFESQPHYMEPYVVQPGDQLRRIAERYNVSWEYLAKLNNTDPRRIRPEQRLKVIKGPFAALIDLSDFEITIHAHGYYVRRYRIGVGKDNSSPIGTFVVQNKVVNPQYTDPEGRVIDADDPSNPLGERWIDLGNSYGIHGTIEPDSIGQARSRGCIRMENADVEEVFDLLVKGSQVVIRR